MAPMNATTRLIKTPPPAPTPSNVEKIHLFDVDYRPCVLTLTPSFALVSPSMVPVVGRFSDF